MLDGDSSSKVEAVVSDELLLVPNKNDVLFKFASFFGRHFGNSTEIRSLFRLIFDDELVVMGIIDDVGVDSVYTDAAELLESVN